MRVLETQRREAVRNPSPPPRTLPGRDDAGNFEQLRRAEAALAQRIDGQREQVRLADRAADEAGRAIAAKATEVDGQRQALSRVRDELAKLPSDAEIAAGLTAASAASREGPQPSALALSDIPDEHLKLYRRAAVTCAGLPWTVLAAIGSVQSSHGRTGARICSRGRQIPE